MPVTESDATLEPELYADLSAAVRAARRGLRSDVAKLVAQLDKGGLLVPLAREISDIPLGETIDTHDGQVKLVPHLLPDKDGAHFVALFTDADVLQTVGQYLDWTTESSESAETEAVASNGHDTASNGHIAGLGQDTSLQYCTLPARAALDLALQIIDETDIHGLVINPSDEHELLLRRSEVASLAQGRAIPLVGYVQEIPYGAEERRLVSELDAPPQPELLAALERCIADLKGVKGYRLQQTFNAERDLEPHPTLFIQLSDPDSVDFNALNQRLAAELDGKLPEPGYIDVLFDSETEAPA